MKIDFRYLSIQIDKDKKLWPIDIDDFLIEIDD